MFARHSFDISNCEQQDASKTKTNGSRLGGHATTAGQTKGKGTKEGS
jgi:hypothetical protein